MGPEDDVQHVMKALSARPPTGERLVVAIAGPPASGKSTLAAKLVQALAPTAGLLAMDAFHLDNHLLRERGDLERKGAPHTFDVDRYRTTLEHLRTGRGVDVKIPTFNRELDAVQPDTAVVEAHCRTIITEGNYLLLDEPPWDSLAPLFDLTVWITQPLEEIGRRIADRWLTHGLDGDAARKRWDTNDGPNARLTIDHSASADVVIGDRRRG